MKFNFLPIKSICDTFETNIMAPKIEEPLCSSAISNFEKRLKLVVEANGAHIKK